MSVNLYLYVIYLKHKCWCRTIEPNKTLRSNTYNSNTRNERKKKKLNAGTSFEFKVTSSH